MISPVESQRKWAIDARGPMLRPSDFLQRGADLGYDKARWCCVASALVDNLSRLGLRCTR